MGVPDPTPPTPVQPIDYRGVPPDVRRRNRTILLVLILLVVLALPLLFVLVRLLRAPALTGSIVLSAPVAVPATPTIATVDYEQQRREQAYAQYLSYAARPGVVVYDEDPVRAAKLLTAQPQLHRQISTESIDSTWASSYDRPVIQISPGDIPGVQPFVDNSNPQNRCTLFVGKLRSPGGNDRLVFLDMKITLNGGRRTRQNAAKGNESDPEYEVRVGRNLEYRIYDAAGLNGFPNQLRSGTSLTIKTPTDKVPIRWIDGSLRADRSANGALQIFAGTLDANDQSHCTIDYDYGGQRGAIDVYLTDDDFLRVLPRTGRVAGGNWEIGAAPATAAAVERSAAQPAP